LTKKFVKVEPALVEPTDLVEDVILDDVEILEPEVEPEPVMASAPTSYVCVYGDTYPGIAARFKPAGLTKHQYAKHLFATNKGKALAAGVEVIL
jgi:hypothetical protein